MSSIIAPAACFITQGWCNGFHYVEDANTIDFIRGKELIIITGMGIEGTKELIRMIQSLINSNASALIVNIGKYIKKVPDEVITLCEED